MGRKVTGFILITVGLALLAGAAFIARLEQHFEPCIDVNVVVEGGGNMIISQCPLDPTATGIQVDVASAHGNPLPFTSQVLTGTYDDPTGCHVPVETTRCDSLETSSCFGTFDVTSVEPSRRFFCLDVHCQADNGQCGIHAMLRYTGGLNEPKHIWRMPTMLGFFVTGIVIGVLLFTCGVLTIKNGANRDEDDDEMEKGKNSSEEDPGEVFNLRLFGSL